MTDRGGGRSADPGDDILVRLAGWIVSLQSLRWRSLTRREQE